MELNVGEKYNYLTIIGKHKENNHMIYDCQCDCGKIRTVASAHKLYRGAVKSCGCLVGLKCAERNRKGRRYSDKDNRLLDIWRHMHRRCENPSDWGYKYYGGKGIAVCDDWKEFEPFASWSYQNGYTNNLTIDRIDSTKNYEPDNCRWVDSKVQNNNSSHCHYLTYNGITASMSEWSERMGISYDAIKSRINKLHWTTEEALTTPYGQKRNKYKISC